MNLHSEKRTIWLGTIVAVLLVIYFYLTLSFFPGFYLSHISLSKPSPYISEVSLSKAQVRLKDTFKISFVAGNNGHNADVQVVSITFPNLTALSNDLEILTSNFSQKPIRVNTGEEIGSDYQGQAKSIPAKFPALDFYSRPWNHAKSYGATLEIRPPTLGQFYLFLRVVAFPHVDNSSHYPRSGIKDYQNEFVKPYSVQVIN